MYYVTRHDTVVGQHAIWPLIDLGFAVNEMDTAKVPASAEANESCASSKSSDDEAIQRVQVIKRQHLVDSAGSTTCYLYRQIHLRKTAMSSSLNIHRASQEGTCLHRSHSSNFTDPSFRVQVKSDWSVPSSARIPSSSTREMQSVPYPFDREALASCHIPSVSGPTDTSTLGSGRGEPIDRTALVDSSARDRCQGSERVDTIDDRR